MWVRLPPPAWLFPVAAALAAAACGGSGVQPSTTVEARGLRAVEVASGLDRPVYVTAAPGEVGRLYVVEQAGIIRVVENGRVVPDPFLDISDQVLTSPKGEFASERGFLSVAFAPDYPASGRFVVLFTDRRGAVNVVQYRARSGHAVPASARRLLLVRKRSERHQGGQLQFGRDGKLYTAIGDDELGGAHSQSLAKDDHLGKVLRLDGTRWTVVAYGLRNPWRFSFDRETGDLWIGDVGESRFEEVNVVGRGAPLVNLGWDSYEGHEEFVGANGEHHEPADPGELVWPLAVYDHQHGCAVTGGYVYRGSEVPEARGRYFFGDYCTGTVWSVDPQRPKEVREELGLGTTLASFGEDEAGELYLVSRTGRIFRLTGS